MEEEAKGELKKVSKRRIALEERLKNYVRPPYVKPSI